MYAFLVLLFPIALFRHFAREESRLAALSSFIAAFFAIVLCSCKAFLSFSYRVPQALFFYEWAHRLFTITVVPASLSALILLVMRIKKSTTECIQAIFPSLCASLAVLLPFETLAGPRSSYSFYELFLCPSLYLMMASSLSSCIALMACRKVRKYIRIASLLLFVVFALVPSIIDTMWFTNIKGKSYLALWGVYVVMSVLCYVFCAINMAQEAQ